MLPQEVVDILKSQKVIFITNPQKVEYSFSNGKLKIWNEEIPYKDLLGVIFVEKPDKPPRVRKIPIIFPPLELKNIETFPYSKEKEFLILKEVCGYVGKYLQVYLKRYLGKRDPLGVGRIKKTFWGFVKRYKENAVFIEKFTDCTHDESLKLVKAKLTGYIDIAYTKGFYGILTLYLGILIADRLGLKIPSDKQLLLYIFLPSAYAMVNMLDIKAGVFDLNSYFSIPVRGQVYTFINEFLNNEAFHEHFVYSLNLLES